jgi:hypothetical protein
MIVKHYFSEEYKIEYSHSHATRSQQVGYYVAPTYVNKYGSRCLEVTVPAVFNSIPVELRNLRRLSLVKKLIKEWLLLSAD